MNLFTVLPMTVVMVAGPQLITAIFLTTGRDVRRASLAYLLGAAIGVTAGTTVAYLIFRLVHTAGGSGHKAGIDRAIDWFVLALLLVLLVLIFVRRRRSRPPAWMGKLQDASTGLAFRLGLLLLLAMPSDVLTMVSVSASLARHDRPWWHLLPFILLTLFWLALPLLLVLALGRRAAGVLPRIRDWTNSHSWLVNEFVILFFLALVGSDLAK
ncbi:GAP family protein [Plantactinospora siamensis]|uniref:GAP family protein n=1 Tax=Plantactinospora siamensis TaxID=555372 RepID=A0ABV6P5M4_9ACTN